MFLFGQIPEVTHRVVDPANPKKHQRRARQLAIPQPTGRLRERSKHGRKASQPPPSSSSCTRITYYAWQPPRREAFRVATFRPFTQDARAPVGAEAFNSSARAGEISLEFIDTCKPDALRQAGRTVHQMVSRVSGSHRGAPNASVERNAQ